MSNINLVIEERTADIGKFQVGRLLPFRLKRMIGPFVYIDHMGPVLLIGNENMDVLPHPHIGLSTLTFLMEGSLMHRDTLGNEIEIKPGEVNWMTAGIGIVHSERTPPMYRNKSKNIHGLQIWVALPKNLETMNPGFFQIEAEEIPKWSINNADYKLIAGEAFGQKSPVPVYSKLFMIEIKSGKEHALNFGEELFGEIGLFILEGSVISEGIEYGHKKLLVMEKGKFEGFTMAANSIIYIFGGEPFPEERFIDWNFVSSNKELIAKAKQKWIDQKFEKIPGDDQEFLPYPSFKK
ncbi:MAG: pirin family protein [Lentimicrobium sp.]|nr:pirin family protein [Lentimicrobium sp.]